MNECRISLLELKVYNVVACSTHLSFILIKVVYLCGIAFMSVAVILAISESDKKSEVLECLAGIFDFSLKFYHPPQYISSSFVYIYRLQPFGKIFFHVSIVKCGIQILLESVAMLTFVIKFRFLNISPKIFEQEVWAANFHKHSAHIRNQLQNARRGI